MWRRWRPAASLISASWRRTGCGFAPARERPRIAAAPGWRSTWLSHATWWSSSSARSMMTRRPATCASARHESGRRESEANGKKTDKPKEPRASTTDPEVRVMKMADGGFRPAYNVQVVTVAAEQIVVAVEPCTVGSDRGLMRPMLEKVHQCFEGLPARYLADGGFMSAGDIEWAHDQSVAV